MRIEVLAAWPGRFESVQIQLPVGSRLGDALDMAGMRQVKGVSAYAVFGVVATVDTILEEGDRVELLRALQIDPKDARRRRAENRAKLKQS